MLAKKFRLTSKDFARVGKQRPTRIIRGLYYSIKTFKTERALPRIAVVAGVKVDKRAVIRNKLKRMVYNFFRLHINEFIAEDYICILYPQVATISEELLLKDLEKLETRN